MKVKQFISILAIFCMVISGIGCISLPAAAEIDTAAAVAEMQGLISYFNQSPAQKDQELSAALEKASNIALNAGGYQASEIAECLAALKTYREKAPYLPRVTQVGQYPNESGYMIFDTTDLLFLANNANNTAKFSASQTIYLGNNLNLSDIGFWPIPKAQFSFDGMGHTIQNWNGKSRYDYQAFFQEFYGRSIKNLTFKDCDLESGYSRAALISELKSPDTLLIENVNMENVKLNAVAGSNSNQNRMGLYISRNTSASPHCDITIRNCYIKDCALTNGNDAAVASVNDSGLIAGHIRNTGALTIENFAVINSASSVETANGGLLVGLLETSGDVVFKNVAVLGGSMIGSDSADSVGILVGMHKKASAPAFENCLVYGVGSSATQVWARGWNDPNVADENEVSTIGATAENCATDLLNPYICIGEGTGASNTDLQFGHIQGIAEIASLAEAVWSINHGKNAPIYYLSNEGNAIAYSAGEGYYLPKKVDFISGIGEDAIEVGTFFTNKDGKISGADALFENILYRWELNGAAVDKNQVYAEDTIVISTVVHRFDGEAQPNGDGTHKIYCAEEGCAAYITADCAHKEYTQNADNTHNSECECGYIIETEACEIEYTFDGIDSHTGICALCGRSGAKEKCNMGEFMILEGDEPTTTAPGKETSSCDKCDHKVVHELKQLAAGTLTLNGRDTIMTDELYGLDLALSGNATPGISGLMLCLKYDATKLSLKDAFLVEGSGFIGLIDSSKAGEIKISLMASTPITSDAALAGFDFNVLEEGEAEFELIVGDAILSGTEIDDPSTTPLAMSGAKKTVRVIDLVMGDVNMDHKVTMADAVLLLRALNDKLDWALLNRAAADVFADQEITTADAIKLLQYIMGKIDTLA